MAEELERPQRPRSVWRCQACNGTFLYERDKRPNFCPYCRSSLLTDVSAAERTVLGDL